MFDDGFRWFGLVVTGLVVLVPIAIGFVLLRSVVRRWLRVRRLTEAGQRATAVVVENQQRSGSGGRVNFLPVVRFVTTTGQEVRAVLDDLASHQSHLTGAEYEVMYDPDEPGGAMRYGQGAGSLIVAVIFALLFFGFAAVALFLALPHFLGDPPGMPGDGFEFP